MKKETNSTDQVHKDEKILLIASELRRCNWLKLCAVLTVSKNKNIWGYYEDMGTLTF